MVANTKKLLLKAKSFVKRGRLYQAKEVYCEILEAYPQNSEAKRALNQIVSILNDGAKSNSGMAYLESLKKLFEESRFEEVVDFFNANATQLGKDTLALNIVAGALKAIGNFGDAIGFYNQSIEINPDFVEAYNNLGNTFVATGDLESAEICFKTAVEKRPEYSLAHNSLGLVFFSTGRREEALQCYLDALKFSPDFSEAHDNLGNFYAGQGDFDKAIGHYESAIKNSPQNASPKNNIGVLLKELGSNKKAAQYYESAILADPNFAEAHSNLGTLHLSEGRYKKAIECYRKALDIKPDYFQARSNLIFSMTSESKVPSGKVLVEAIAYGEMCSKTSAKKYSMWNCDYKATTLNIGFISGDISNHPVGYFLEGVLPSLSKGSFELYGYPTTSHEDELTARLKPFFKKWSPLLTLDWISAARKIHEDNIHILIDLAGHTAGNALPVFSYKPAPVQCTWLGYFGTTGIKEIDFLLGDPYVTPPEEEHHFSEKIWRLPETYLCFAEPGYPVKVESLPAIKNGYVTFGCFNNLAKITDEVVSTWALILKNVHKSKLFLKSKQFDSFDLQQQTINRFRAHDIKTERILLEGASLREEYLSSYNKIDILLDPFPYPGGTTSAEALWMGVPSVVLAGDRFLSHLGESVAYNSGQSDWVAVNCEEYVAKAIKFSSELESLALLRNTLRQKALKSPLFDQTRFVKYFSGALWDIWRASNHGV